MRPSESIVRRCQPDWYGVGKPVRYHLPRRKQNGPIAAAIVIQPCQLKEPIEAFFIAFEDRFRQTFVLPFSIAAIVLFPRSSSDLSPISIYHGAMTSSRPLSVASLDATITGSESESVVDYSSPVILQSTTLTLARHSRGILSCLRRSQTSDCWSKTSWFVSAEMATKMLLKAVEPGCDCIAESRICSPFCTYTN
ncbi:hypothetical protein PGTUg99_034608 [Puccinia graminis f. sp. tritici]|uniref:Uncharacterized protein n=1 Tax=Puccinia graminis f. sp. tritici TaxID=56615 RepID=A0A5B0RB01_PUCGR|nr:hypothetical protein PGTUg99_034608 [Puccinia graminis f. sp. tritici]